MKRVAIALIRFYRKHLSGLKPAPTCRFTPTCSAYALEAFEKRGFFAGLTLSVWRILRCSPLSPAGFDPVPLSGFKTMPLRWSRFDRYRAEQEQVSSDDILRSDAVPSDARILPDDDTSRPADEDTPSTDEHA